MMDAVSATICDGAYPKLPRRRRGKRHHHGGDVCGLVVLGVNSTFRAIPTVGILRGGSFLFPLEPIAVKLLNDFFSKRKFQRPE